MTENEFTYWAFLSYGQLDNCEQRPDAQGVCRLCWGDWLHNALKAFPIPAEFAGQINARAEIIPERIDRIFQDREEQPESASLSESVRQALEQSKCLIVVCSPRSAKSRHVNEAVRYFKQLGRGNRILPFVVAGEPHASDGNQPGLSPDDECFVPALRHPVKPDGILDTTRRERRSIFADARQGNDKREILAQDHQNGEIELETAKIQLIAGLLGVGFNGLWGHELKRRFAEAQIQSREVRPQIQETRNQAPEAQNKVLEAQNQAREAQQQIQELRNQTQEAQSKVLEAQNQAREALGQVAEARSQARVAESKFLEAQHQVREAQSQLEASRNEVREAQNKALEIQNLPPDAKSQIQEAQNQARNAQGQLEETRSQARDTQNKFLEAQIQVQKFQNRAREVQSQLEEARNQLREVQGKVLDAQNQARAAQDKVLEMQNQTRDAQSQLQEVHSQAREAQNHVQETERKARKARRLTKILALMAVLALLAASLAASIALRQRLAARQALAKAASEAVWKSDWAPGRMDQDHIQRALRNIGGAEQYTNRLRSLDKLAAWIPRGEIPEALKAAAIISTDQQRCHFQKWLLVRLGWVNPQSAMTNASAIQGKIVNNDGAGDFCIYFQLAVLDNWMKTDLPGAFTWVCQLPDADSRQRALEKIIPALAADNPTSTLAVLNNLKPAPDERIYTLLFQRWADHDPVQAIQLRQQTPHQDAGDKILCAIVRAWVDREPDAALNWIKSQPNSESKNKGLEACIDELTKTDFPRALNLAQSLPEGAWRSTLIAGLFNNWAAKDLEAATKACQQLPDGMAKEKAWESVLNRRIEQDPASAAEPVKDLEPGDYREKAIVELCYRWPDTNAPAALAWGQSLPSEAERVAALGTVVTNWAGKDPQAAMQFVNQHPELSGDVLGEIAKAWSQSDWSAATNWVENLPNGQQKDAALQALTKTWAQKDPNGMATYALGLPAGDDQTRYLTAACRQLAIRNLPETVELLKQVSDAGLRQSILEQAARSCDLPHLNQAANYIAAMPADGDQKAAVKGLLFNWTPADPETALDWLRAFPETNAQPEQVQSVIKAWSQHEPAAAAKWLANLPPGTTNDAMVSAFLEGAVAKYPEYAAQWTQSVTNETTRQKFQLQVARQWMKSDPAAAMKWINSLDLPEEIKQPLKSQ